MSSVQPFILVLGYAADIGTTGGNYAGDSETVCLNQNISGTIFLKHYFRRCLFPEWSKPETYFTRDDCVSRTYPCNEPQNIYCWELKFISKNKMFIITFAYLVKKKKKRKSYIWKIHTQGWDSAGTQFCWYWLLTADIHTGSRSMPDMEKHVPM